MIETELWNKWFERESNKLKRKDKYRPAKRRYLHFDSRLDKLNSVGVRAMLTPDAVAKHSFYPFIRVDTREERFRRPKDKVKGDKRRELVIKKRPIDYASHKDALVYSWYATMLASLYDRELSSRGIGEHVIAYRSLKKRAGDKGKTNIHFAQEAFDFIRGQTPCSVIALDVSKFFEEMRHDILKQKWSGLLGVSTLPDDHFKVFRAVTGFRFVRKGRISGQILKARRQEHSRIFTPSEFQKFVIGKHLQEKGSEGKGIPQGAPISCVLANLYMIDFDTMLAGAVKEIGGLYRRYSDDILIVCPPNHAERIENLVMTEVQGQNLGLKIKEEKTEKRLCVTNEGVVQSLDIDTQMVSSFQYLGIETDGSRLLLRHGSLARFQRRMNDKVRSSVRRAFEKDRKSGPKNFLHRKFAIPFNNFLGYANRAGIILNAPAIGHQASPLRESRRLERKIQKVTSSEKLKKALKEIQIDNRKFHPHP